MNNLTKLKLTQKIKQGLYEFCSDFYIQERRYPTVKEINEIFSIPDFLYPNVEITESLISSIASILTEAAGVRAPVRPERIPRAERAERESRGRETTFAEPSAFEFTPELIDIFNRGGTPEEGGVTPRQWVETLTDKQLEQYKNNRQKAVDSGSPPNSFDAILGIRTPETPQENPKIDSEPETDVEAQAIKAAANTETQSAPVEDEEVNNIVDKSIEAIKDILGRIPQPQRQPEVPSAPPVQEPEEAPLPIIPGSIEIPGETENAPEEKVKTQDLDEPSVEERVKTQDLVEPSVEERVKTITPFEITTDERTKTETTSRVRPKSEVDDKTKTEPSRGRGPKPGLGVAEPLAPPKLPPPGTGSGENKKQSGDDDDSGSGIKLEREPALRSTIEGIKLIKEAIYNPQKSLKKKEKKQKFKVVVHKEGGKKVEIFASSLKGVRRVIFGKKHFKVFNQSGTEMTNYFKKQQKKPGI